MRRRRLEAAGKRAAFSVRVVYTAVALATGVFVVFVAGAGWNMARWVRRLVRRRRPGSSL